MFVNLWNRYLGGIKVKKLGIITISMAIIVNVVGTNVMAKDETKDYSLYGYEQWKGYESNHKKEIVDNGIVNPMFPETDTKISSKNKTNDETCTQTEVKEQNSSDSIEKNFNYMPPHDDSFMKWHQPSGYDHYSGVEWKEKKEQPSSNAAPSEVPAWHVNDKIYQKQAATKAPEQTPDYNTKKSEKNFTYNAHNYPVWGHIPGTAYIPNQEQPSGYNPPVYGQNSDNTSEQKQYTSETTPDKSGNKDFSKEQNSNNTSKPEFHQPSYSYNSNPWWQNNNNYNMPAATPDISSSKDSSKEQNSDNTSKPEFHQPSYSYDSNPWWQNHNNMPVTTPDISTKEDFHKEQNSDNTSEPKYHIPTNGYNSTPWWQNAYNMDKHNFDGDKLTKYPVQQRIDGIDTSFLQDTKSSSKLALVNVELEKSRQELVVIKNNARRQIGIEIKETRKEMYIIVGNNSIGKKEKKLKINELKTDFKLKVKNIKEDAELKAKDVIEKQDSNIQSILS